MNTQASSHTPLSVYIIKCFNNTAPAADAGVGCLDIFPLSYHFSLLSPSLWETAQYRLKYCLKGPFRAVKPQNNHQTILLLSCILGQFVRVVCTIPYVMRFKSTAKVYFITLCSTITNLACKFVALVLLKYNIKWLFFQIMNTHFMLFFVNPFKCNVAHASSERHEF